MSNEDVIRAFNAGEPKQENNLASIPITEGGRALLVGYGYACYALRHSDGHVTRFNGWMGHSQTTSTHLNLLDDIVNDESESKYEVYEALYLFGPRTT